MKFFRTIAPLALALCAGSAFSSCEGLRAKPGVDGTAYSLGHLDAMVSASPQRVVEAATRVLEEMEIQLVTSAASGVDGKVSGRTALDKRIDITVHRQDTETTKLSIQVGTFGEEALSREIYDRIKAKL
jgi:hypothetical protein